MAWNISTAKRRALVKLQLRDKHGRWIEMGGGVKWYSSRLKKNVAGIVVGSRGDKALVKLNGDDKNKPEYVAVKARSITVVDQKASLDGKPTNESAMPNKNNESSAPQHEVANPSAPSNNEEPENIEDFQSENPDDYTAAATEDGYLYVGRKDGGFLYVSARALKVGDEVVAPSGAPEEKPYSIGRGWIKKKAVRIDPDGPGVGKVVSIAENRYALVELPEGVTVNGKNTVTIGMANSVVRATGGVKAKLDSTFRANGEDRDWTQGSAGRKNTQGLGDRVSSEEDAQFRKDRDVAKKRNENQVAEVQRARANNKDVVAKAEVGDELTYEDSDGSITYRKLDDNQWGMFTNDKPERGLQKMEDSEVALDDNVLVPHNADESISESDANNSDHTEGDSGTQGDSNGDSSEKSTEASEANMSLDDLEAQAKADGDTVLYHGGLPEGTTLDDIDLNRNGTQQNKRGRSFGGFYLTDESSKKWSEDYADKRNGVMHGFAIDKNARIDDRGNEQIDRLSEEDRAEAAKDFDVIKGKDLLGRSQYVLLNKDAVMGVGETNLKNSKGTNSDSNNAKETTEVTPDAPEEKKAAYNENGLTEEEQNQLNAFQRLAKKALDNYEDIKAEQYTEKADELLRKGEERKNAPQPEPEKPQEQETSPEAAPEAETLVSKTLGEPGAERVLEKAIEDNPDSGMRVNGKVAEVTDIDKAQDFLRDLVNDGRARIAGSNNPATKTRENKMNREFEGILSKVNSEQVNRDGKMRPPKWIRDKQEQWQQEKNSDSVKETPKETSPDPAPEKKPEENKPEPETTPETPQEEQPAPAEKEKPNLVEPDTAPETAPEEAPKPAEPVKTDEENPLPPDVERHAPEALEGEKYAPTQQQQDVIDAVLAGKDTIVQAKAGAGKTSTLEAIARRIQKRNPNEGIIYIAFNKSVQLEADDRMPENVESRTGHSLAFQAAPKWMQARSTPKDNPKVAASIIRRPGDIARHFDIKHDENLKADKKVDLADDAVSKYAFSADDSIGLQHFDQERIAELSDGQKNELLRIANEFWQDRNREDGVLRLDPDHYRKVWALNRPDLRTAGEGSGLKSNADILFIDEAQDTPPVLAKVVSDQNMQKVVVGDADQAIYGFTGATDYLSKAEGDVRLPLNNSWRFGPEVADAGNRFLELLGSPERVVGAGPKSEIVNGMDDPDAILTRSNSGMVGEILNEMEKERTIAVPKNAKAKLDSIVDSVKFLQGITKYRPKNMDEDLAKFDTWKEVVDEAEETKNPALTKITSMVAQHGIVKIDKMVQRVHTLGNDGQGKPGEVFKDTYLKQEGNLAYLTGKTYDNRFFIRDAGFQLMDDPTGAVTKFGKNKGKPKQVWGFRGNDAQREEALQKLYKNAIFDPETNIRGRADVTVSTAHMAKGLEWGRVKIGDDFRGPELDEETGDTKLPDPEELRLYYVAVTRAEKALDPGSLGWVYDITEPNGGDPKANAPETNAPEQNSDTVKENAPEVTPEPARESEPDVTPETQPESQQEPDTTPEQDQPVEETPDETPQETPKESTPPTQEQTPAKEEAPTETQPEPATKQPDTQKESTPQPKLSADGLLESEQKRVDELEQLIGDIYSGKAEGDVTKLENEVDDLLRIGERRKKGENIPETDLSDRYKDEEPAVEPDTTTEPETAPKEHTPEPAVEPKPATESKPETTQPEAEEVKPEPPKETQPEPTTTQPRPSNGLDEGGLTAPERRRANELERWINDIYTGRGNGNVTKLENELDDLLRKGEERLKPKPAETTPEPSKPAETKPADVTPETKAPEKSPAKESTPAKEGTPVTEEKPTRTRRSFKEGGKFVVAGDGTEIRPNTKALHKKLGEVDIVDVVPSSGRVKYIDPTTGATKSADAKLISGKPDAGTTTPDAPEATEPTISPDTPAGTRVFDPEQGQEVFISNNGQRVARGARVRHSKKGEGVVKAIYPGADGGASVRVAWDDGTENRAKGTTLDGLDSPSVYDTPVDNSKEEFDKVAKEKIEKATEPDPAPEEPKAEEELPKGMKPFDAPKYRTSPFDLSRVIAWGIKEYGMDDWQSGLDLNQTLTKTKTGNPDIDLLKDRVFSGTGTFHEASDYFDALEKHFESLVKAAPRHPDFKKKLDQVRIAQKYVAADIADPSMDEDWIDKNSSARHAEPLKDWDRSDLMLPDGEPSDMMYPMELGAVLRSYRVGTVVSQLDKDGDLVGTYQKNSKGQWLERDRDGSYVGAGVTFSLSAPMRDGARFVVDEPKRNDSKWTSLGNKDTTLGVNPRDGLFDNLPIGSVVEFNRGTRTKLRDDLWRHDQTGAITNTPKDRPFRVDKAEGVEVEEVIPIGPDTYDEIKPGNARNKLLKDAPERSQFYFANSPEAIWTKEGGVWVERVSGVKTGKTVVSASLEPEFNDKDSWGHLLMPNGVKVDDLLDLSLDSDRFDMETYDGSADFSDYDPKSSKFNPISEVSTNSFEPDDLYTVIGGKKFHLGGIVRDRDGNDIGKIAGVLSDRILLDSRNTPVIRDGQNTRKYFKADEVIENGWTPELTPDSDYSKEIDYDTLAIQNLVASLKARYPGLQISMEGMDITKAREMARTIDRILTKYPQLRHSLNKITAEDFGSFNAAGVSSNMGNSRIPFSARNLSVNSASANRANFRRGVQQQGDLNNLVKVPEGREVEYIMTHEFGHSLDYLTGNISDDKMLELISQALGRKVTRNDKALRDELIRKKMLTKYSTRGLPEFGHMPNSAVGDDVFSIELAAESFADVEINGVNARPLSKLIHKEIIDKLKEY
jgi:superfamily I DNA/RNA helicase